MIGGIYYHTGLLYVFKCGYGADFLFSILPELERCFEFYYPYLGGSSLCVASSDFSTACVPSGGSCYPSTYSLVPSDYVFVDDLYIDLSSEYASFDYSVPFIFSYNGVYYSPYVDCYILNPDTNEVFSGYLNRNTRIINYFPFLVHYSLPSDIYWHSSYFGCSDLFSLLPLESLPLSSSGEYFYTPSPLSSDYFDVFVFGSYTDIGFKLLSVDYPLLGSDWFYYLSSRYGVFYDYTVDVSEPRYSFLINVLPKPNFLDSLLGFYDSNPCFGCCGRRSSDVLINIKKLLGG